MGTTLTARRSPSASGSPLLIGLYSPTQGQGKSTVAGLMKARLGRTEILSFATPLKLATAAFLEALGLSDVEATEAVFDDKDAVLPTLGITGRNALVLIAQSARVRISPDIWVRALMRRVAMLRPSVGGYNIIVDDVRMQNEADAVLAAGGFLVQVIRPGHSPAKVDPATEGRLSGYRFDATITNDAGLADLNEQARETLRTLRALS